MDSNTGQPDFSPDFSHLPDVAWIKILSYVPFKDRYCVSQTCHVLNSVFHHPSLWAHVEVLLTSYTDNESASLPSGHKYIDPYRQLELISRFGRYIKSLTLVYITHQYSMEKECKAVVQTLIDNCRVEYLTLEVEIVKGKRDLFYAGNSSKLFDLDPICELLVNSDRLKGLTLRSWPLHRRVNNQSVFKVLQTDRMSHRERIKQLHLFWECASQATWAPMNIDLPSPEDTLDLLQPFTGLTSLALRSCMINEDLLLLLSKTSRTPLRNLYILVTYSAHRQGTKIPELSAAAWKSLTQYAPDLCVEMTIMTRVPIPLLLSLLKPEVPLGALEFMKYADLNIDVIKWIQGHHAETLYKFISYNITGEDFDDSWLKVLIAECRRLTQFVFMGKIHSSTVQYLAASRGSSWKRFQFMEDNITTHINTEEDFDEETVVRQMADGSFQLAGRHNPHAEHSGEHWERLEEMVTNVSHSLGYKWLPLHSRMLEFNQCSHIVGVMGGIERRETRNPPTKYPIAKGWPWVDTFSS